MLSMDKDNISDDRNKKRFRRTANEIERRFTCWCGKAYGSEGSLNQHKKNKKHFGEVPPEGFSFTNNGAGQNESQRNDSREGKSDSEQQPMQTPGKDYSKLKEAINSPDYEKAPRHREHYYHEWI